MISIIKSPIVALLILAPGLAFGESITTNTSPSFNSKSVMSGALSNVQVNNMIQGQRQRVGETDCQSGWTFTAGGNVSDSDSNQFNYDSRNSVIQMSVGTTVFDRNEKTCQSAMKASLYRMHTQNSTDLFRFCGQLYATLKDVNAPKLNLDNMRAQNTELGRRIDMCLSMVSSGEDFRHAPPIIKSLVDQGVKAVMVNEVKRPVPISYRVHYGNYGKCKSCINQQRLEIEGATGISTDRIKLIEFYNMAGEPRLSINVTGFDTELSAIEFANINKDRIDYVKVSGVYRWSRYAASPW